MSASIFLVTDAKSLQLTLKLSPFFESVHHKVIKVSIRCCVPRRGFIRHGNRCYTGTNKTSIALGITA